MVASGQIIIFLYVSCLAITCEATSGFQTEYAAGEASESGNEIEFSAYRLEPIHSSQHSDEPLLFEGLHRNNGGRYDLTTGYFSAPVRGLYLFNFTSDVTVEKRLRLMKNDYEVVSVRKDGKSSSKNSANKNILLQLNANDRMWLRVAHGKRQKNLRGSSSSATTFSGRFLAENVYTGDVIHHNARRHKRSVSPSLQRVMRNASLSPVSLVPMTPFVRERENHDATITTPKIAFSVTCTKSMIGGHMADTTRSLDGPISPEAAPNGRVSFDKVLVNVGNSFDVGEAEFRAPTSGVYFFSYNVGKFPKKKLSVMLMKNFNEVQSIVYNDSRNRAREMQSQSLMLDLQKGDTLWLRSHNQEDYAVYSNLGNYITFNGYLVFAL